MPKDEQLATAVNQTQIENIAALTTSDQIVYIPLQIADMALVKDQYCTEESPLKPISHYGITKVNGEKAPRRKEIQLHLDWQLFLVQRLE